MNGLSTAMGFPQIRAELGEELGNELIGQAVRLAGVTDMVFTEKGYDKPYEM